MTSSRAKITDGRLEAHAEAGEHVTVWISHGPPMVIEKVQTEFSGCFRKADVRVVSAQEGEFKGTKANATDSFFDTRNGSGLESDVDSHKAPTSDSDELENHDGSTVAAIVALYNKQCEGRKVAVETYKKKTEAFMTQLKEIEEPSAYLLAAIEAHKKITESFIEQLQEWDSRQAAAESRIKDVEDLLKTLDDVVKTFKRNSTESY